jgi:hypothetical protein
MAFLESIHIFLSSSTTESRFTWIFIICLLDLITGIAASSYSKVSIHSKGLRRTAEKMASYYVLFFLSLYMKIQLSGPDHILQYPDGGDSLQTFASLTPKAIFVYILGTEVVSILENTGTILRIEIPFIKTQKRD